MDESTLLDRLRGLEIETPSWGYGNSGTRFHVFPWPGAARSVEERIADAGLVHRLTGCCPSVALHIPWDAVDDYAALARHAADQGLRIGAINPNLFGDDEYRLGSLCHPDEAVRARALDDCRECIAIAEQRRLDHHQPLARRRDQLRGAGQPARPARAARRGPRRALRSAARRHAAADRVQVLRAAFYSTDLPDWGTAALLCRQLGPQAQVLVDTGHHPLGTNVEQIVAVLLGQGLLGGFHFNNRKYADDDLIVGSVDPFELFRIMCEIAWTPDADRIAFMIDQSHNIEGKIDAMIQSVMNIQTAYAKALLVDTDRLAAAQREGDVLGAHRVLLDAFETDVRPVLARLRRAVGVPEDPVLAFRESGYADEVSRERGTASVQSAYES